MDERFQRLGMRFIDESPGLSPVTATAIGDHRYDGTLDEVSSAARDRERTFYQELLRDLDQIDRDQLARANQVDYQLLRHELRHRLWDLDWLQELAWNPVLYTQLVGGSIYNLMARDFAPIEQRLANATSRLEQFPRLYEQSRDEVDDRRHVSGRTRSRRQVDESPAHFNSLSTYFVGFQEHRDMRSVVEKEWAHEFTLKRYHDRALSFGSPPLRFVRALLLDHPIPN